MDYIIKGHFKGLKYVKYIGRDFVKNIYKIELCEERKYATKVDLEMASKIAKQLRSEGMENISIEK